MRTYIIYDSKGDEVGMIRCDGHNKAESMARTAYGPMASVAETEVSEAVEKTLAVWR